MYSKQTFATPQKQAKYEQFAIQASQKRGVFDLFWKGLYSRLQYKSGSELRLILNWTSNACSICSIIDQNLVNN